MRSSRQSPMSTPLERRALQLDAAGGDLVAGEPEAEQRLAVADAAVSGLGEGVVERRPVDLDLLAGVELLAAGRFVDASGDEDRDALGGEAGRRVFRDERAYVV